MSQRSPFHHPQTQTSPSPNRPNCLSRRRRPRSPSSLWGFGGSFHQRLDDTSILECITDSSAIKRFVDGNYPGSVRIVIRMLLAQAASLDKHYGLAREFCRSYCRVSSETLSALDRPDWAQLGWTGLILRFAWTGTGRSLPWSMSCFSPCIVAAPLCDTILVGCHCSSAASGRRREDLKGGPRSDISDSRVAFQLQLHLRPTFLTELP